MDTQSGSYKVDIVVLHIHVQEDNCICRVRIENKIEPISITLRKYHGLASSAPEDYGCGIAVDINYILDISTGNVIALFACVVNTDLRHTPFLQNSILQHKSRIIDGNFTRGYYMRIQRGNTACRVPLEIKECYIKYI